MSLFTITFDSETESSEHNYLQNDLNQGDIYSNLEKEDKESIQEMDLHYDHTIKNHIHPPLSSHPAGRKMKKKSKKSQSRIRRKKSKFSNLQDDHTYENPKISDELLDDKSEEEEYESAISNHHQNSNQEAHEESCLSSCNEITQKPHLINKDTEIIKTEEEDAEEMIQKFREERCNIPEELSSLILYRLQRIKKTTWKGNRILFHLIQGTVPIFSTKIKSKKIQKIFIAEGAEMHFHTGNFPGIIDVNLDNTKFSLRKNQDGPILCELIINPSVENTPRSSTIHFYTDISGIPNEISNRSASITKFGYLIDFSGRHGIKSIKNCIMVDAQGSEVISIRKISKTEFAIDASSKLSNLIVFMFGLGQTLCKK